MNKAATRRINAEKYAFLFFGLMMIALTAGFSKNVYGQPEFFMRYEHPNAEKLRIDIDESYKVLEATRKNRKNELFFQTAIDLGEMLTVARREKEAVEILKPLLKSIPDKAKPEDRAWLYLNYATANQYFLRKKTAESYFKKALKFVRKHELESVEHYVLHHYGRFLVEKGDLNPAEKHFEEALKIRKKLNDERLINTQKALEKLKEMKAGNN